MSAVSKVMSALSKSEAGSSARRIIVAEDEILQRLMISEALRAAGFTVHEALNGDEAISLLNAIPDVDAVLTDMRMRTLADGMAVLEFVRAHHPDVLILLVSAHCPEAAHFDAVFSKPVEPSQIIDWLTEQMKARGAQRHSG